MLLPRPTLLPAALLASCLALPALTANAHGTVKKVAKAAPMPHQRLTLPPTEAQAKYNLPPSKAPRLDLLPVKSSKLGQKTPRALTTTPACQDMNVLASYSASALADYIVNLPDYSCHYGLFSLNAAQATTVYSAGNFNAVATRFVQEAAKYDASNIALVNLLIYLRAGYYLASGNTIPAPDASLTTLLRPAIKQLVGGTALYQSNTAGPSTARETMTLITNMHDEAYYLPDMKNLVIRYTNGAGNPNASLGLMQDSAAGGFTGALTIIFDAHSLPDGQALLQNDLSYPTALDNFVVNDRAALMGTPTAYQLTDASNEAFRFMQYPALLPSIKPMVQQMLASTSMTGADNDLWLAAASAVKYYDNGNCADYGTCNFETKLAAAVLANRYTCSPSIHINSQELTTAQLQSSCALLQTEEGYFHNMLQTNRVPVANDNNTSLEVVVFSDYANYSKYAPILYGNSTNNGGIYLEGDPSNPANQARFIAFEASWLRPTFQVWNLTHEYVHYLDGRFDMYGDFATETQQPTVWWLEGLAEYISKKNDNQASIDIAKTGTYKLSQIFGNTYSMNDYVTRAYNWGYMALRFMWEQHHADIDAFVPKFRVGDYNGYEAYMTNIGSKYDTEFVNWAQTATTAGDPPMPGGSSLPACPSAYYLGQNCSISGWASSTQAYAYIMVPAGTTNLKLSTSGGTGDVDLYVAVDRYPTTTSYDAASATAGNNESVTIASPTAGHWYYIVLSAKQPFSGVTLSATYN